MMSAMKEFNITKDEIVDVLRVVLLMSGMLAQYRVVIPRELNQVTKYY